ACRVEGLQIAAEAEVGAFGAQQHGAQVGAVQELGGDLLEVAPEGPVEGVATRRLRQAQNGQAVLQLDPDGVGGCHRMSLSLRANPAIAIQCDSRLYATV